MRTAATYYLIVVATTSLWSVLVYWLDKRLAQMGSRRISEGHLHMIALVGGWPGALVAQQLFRHKTQKRSFRIEFWGTVVIHLGVVGVVVYSMWGQ